MPRIVRGTPPRAASRILPNLRAADLREISRATGQAPAGVLERSLVLSTRTFHIIHEDEIGTIGGVVTSPADSRVGVPWMVATDLLTRHRHWFARNTAAIWKLCEGAGYTVLTNQVDADNLAHIRWLRWSGCRFGRTHIVNGIRLVDFARPCHV